jgi:formyltetrahydrofolate synthetase
VYESPGTAAILKRKEDGMMLARHSRQDESLNLQRTVDALSEQLREVQWELQHKNEPFWKSLGFRKAASEFMSTVCNRRIRPNIKAAG